MKSNFEDFLWGLGLMFIAGVYFGVLPTQGWHSDLVVYIVGGGCFLMALMEMWGGYKKLREHIRFLYGSIDKLESRAEAGDKEN